MINNHVACTGLLNAGSHTFANTADKGSVERGVMLLWITDDDSRVYGWLPGGDNV
jgi:hypothetical protein